MQSAIEYVSAIPKSVVGKSLFGVCFLMILVSNLLNAYIHKGDWPKGIVSDDSANPEVPERNEFFENQFRNLRQLFIVLLVFLSQVCIALPLAWNIGKNIKSFDGLLQAVVPVGLYAVGVFVLTHALGYANSVKGEYTDFPSCPFTGTVGTANGNVACKRSKFTAFSDSLIDTISQLNKTVPFSGTATDLPLSFMIFPIVLGVSVYIHQIQKRV